MVARDTRSCSICTGCAEEQRYGKLLSDKCRLAACVPSGEVRLLQISY
jgi:hypothetical protein